MDIEDYNRVLSTKGSKERVHLGVVHMENNTYYEGEWMNGKRYGKGK